MQDLIGFIAAVDTSRFKRVEDGERVSIIGTCWRYRRVIGVVFDVADLQER